VGGGYFGDNYKLWEKIGGVFFLEDVWICLVEEV